MAQIGESGQIPFPPAPDLAGVSADVEKYVKATQKVRNHLEGLGFNITGKPKVNPVESALAMRVRELEAIIANQANAQKPDEKRSK